MNRLSRVIQAPGGVTTASDYTSMTVRGSVSASSVLSAARTRGTTRPGSGSPTRNTSAGAKAAAARPTATAGRTARRSKSARTMASCAIRRPTMSRPSISTRCRSRWRTPQGAPAASLSYLETDHLGTPRVLADPATNAVQWQWNFFGSVFGDHAPTAIAGGIQLDSRFPGQFYDDESGLHHNYFRRLRTQDRPLHRKRSDRTRRRDGYLQLR